MPTQKFVEIARIGKVGMHYWQTTRRDRTHFSLKLISVIFISGYLLYPFRSR